MSTQDLERILEQRFDEWIGRDSEDWREREEFAASAVVPAIRPFDIDEADVEALDTASAPDRARRWLVPQIPADTAPSARSVKHFVNGRDYCADLYTSLMQARRHIYLTGLHFMHDFGLVRTASQNVKLVDVLRSKAEQGVQIRLLVNLFWPQEGATIGTWRGPQFTYFMAPRTRPGGARQTVLELAAVWPFPTRGERLVKAFIGAQGQIERYFPATYQLFKKLNVNGVKCRLDVHPGHVMHSHHQKTVVIDDRIAYVGGIDLTHVDGDRWDTAAHQGSHRYTDRAEKYWHDVHGRLDGSTLVRHVSNNFKSRWRNGRLYYIPVRYFRGTPRAVQLAPDTNAAREFPRAVPPHHTTTRHRELTAAEIRRRQRPIVQVVRSMPDLPPVSGRRRRYNIAPGARWDRSAKDAYLTGIAAAGESIYLENQWISDEDLWDGLVASASANQHNRFRIVLMMPNKPLRAAGAGANQDIFVEIHLLRLLIAARHSETVSAFSLVKPDDAKQIYVHSKLMIVDDVWTLLGSANAGGISLEGVRDFPGLLRIARGAVERGSVSPGDLIEVWRIFSQRGTRPDTELSFITLHGAFANGLRTQLWTEHLYRSRRRLTGRLVDDVRTMREVANLGRYRLRNHPYLVTAFRFGRFPGIDLRVFGLSAADVLRALAQLVSRGGAAPPGAIQVLTELRKIPQMLNAVAVELRRQGRAGERRGWQIVQSSLGPYLDRLAAESPVARSEFQAMRQLLAQLAAGRPRPNA